MLLPEDELPLHQTNRPFAHSASGHPNHYDRYFFNAHRTDGSLIVGGALGVYPERDVIDASLTVVHEGRQRSLHASGRLPRRRDPRVGPLRVDVLEPLRSIRLTADAAEQGIAAELRFDAVTPAVEEDPHRWAPQGRPVIDSHRFTQWGGWTGTLEVDGVTHRLDPAEVHGVRDRSWGLRPIGDQPTTAPATSLPEFFWLWAPLRFPDRTVLFAVQEDAAGLRWHETGRHVALLEEAAAGGDGHAVDDGAGVDHLQHLHAELRWEPGTRRARDVVLSAAPPDGGGPWRISLTPLGRIAMLGLGYQHPHWSHGRWHGEEVVGTSSWDLDDLDPTALEHLHVQQVVRAELDEGNSGGDARAIHGVGLLEQLVLGPHRPSGIVGFTDPAAER